MRQYNHEYYWNLAEESRVTTCSFDTFELPHVTEMGSPVHDKLAVWADITGQRILCLAGSGMEALGPYYAFTLTNLCEEIRLTIGIFDYADGNDPSVACTVQRQAREGEDRLPPGIGMRFYDKVPAFIQFLTPHWPSLVHGIAYNQVGGVQMERGRRWSKFGPFIYRYGYEKVEGYDVWNRRYSAYE